jgi:hypothetical protein
MDNMALEEIVNTGELDANVKNVGGLRFASTVEKQTNANNVMGLPSANTVVKDLNVNSAVGLSSVSITGEDYCAKNVMEENIIVICATKHIHRKAIWPITKKVNYTNLCVSLKNKSGQCLDSNGFRQRLAKQYTFFC